MKPECYKCFSVGLGIFMLMWMITALHLSLEGVNAEQIFITGDSRDKWKSVGENYHLYQFKHQMDKLRDLHDSEIKHLENMHNQTRKQFSDYLQKILERVDTIEKRLAARCVLIVGEIVIVLMAVGVLCRRVAASSKSVLEAAACGMAAVACLICGSIEAWFASGKAMSFEEQNHRNFGSSQTTTFKLILVLFTTGGWIAATVFLFLGIILWIMNAVVAMMNPGSADDPKGRTGSHVNLAGRPSANLQPYVGNPQFPQPIHQ